jgi:tetratricopeptide (TPR) repeat protein
MKRCCIGVLTLVLTVLVASAQTPSEDGIRLFKDGKPAEARTLLVKAVADNPSDAAAHAYLGLVYKNLDRNFDKAIAEAEMAVQLVDGNAEYHFWLGACYISKAQAQMQGSGIFKAMSAANKSKAAWERAIALDPKHVEARLSLLTWYLNAPGIVGGSVSKARAQATAIEALDPLRGNLAFAAIHQYEKEWPEAEKRYLQAIAIDPSNANTRAALIGFYSNAPASYAGALDKAKEQANALVKIDALRGNLILASIYQRESKWSEAENAYREAVAANPKHAGARNTFGYLLLGRDRADEAIAEFKVAAELTPNDANAHDSLAEGYLTKGLVDEAIAEYKAALALNPEFASSYLGLGKCYEKQAKWHEARASYQQLVDRLPKHRQADEARSKLKGLAKKG